LQNNIQIKPLIKNPDSKNGCFPLSLKDLNEFITCIWNIPYYINGNSNKVMPIYLQELSDLNPDNSFPKNILPGSNPFFRHLKYLQYYICRKNSETVGRIACIIDNNYTERGTKGDIGWISLFESIEDDEVANSLLNKAITDLKEHNVQKIIGPSRFNANGEVGLLISGYEYSPMFMEPYNPPYYQKYFEAIGKKENDWYGFGMTLKSVIPYMEKILSFSSNGLNLEGKILKEGISVRKIDINKDLHKIKDIYNSAWDTMDHPQFEKLTDAEFANLITVLKQVAIEDFVLIAEDITNPEKPIIGVSVTLPDINEAIKELDNKKPDELLKFKNSSLFKKILRDLSILKSIKGMIKKRNMKKLRIFILGTIKKKKGLDALFYLKTIESAYKAGIEFASGSEIADINLEMVNPLRKLGYVTFTWRVYNINF
jgi:hypothetical protein